MRARGFTLIELLVVIAIIALLMSILMPALGVAREQGRRAVCAQNEKNMGLGLNLYANDYNGKVPINEVDRWLFDVSYWTTDIILKSGAFDRHIFYCPSWRQRDRIIFWRYGENLPGGTPEGYLIPEPADEPTRRNYHRIMGYFWLIDAYTNTTKTQYRTEYPFGLDGRRIRWVRSLVTTKAAPASLELITDCTLSDGPDRLQADFTLARGGCYDRWRVYDRTSHLRKSTKPTGGNILFVDGHVQWRKFEEMDVAWPPPRANPCFWW